MAKVITKEEKLARQANGLTDKGPSAQVRKSRAPEAQDDFKVLGHSDLMERVDVSIKFLAGPVLQAGIPGLFVGPGGVGKSTWLQGVAMAIASGESTLGLSIPEPLPVLFYQFEDSEEVTRRRYQSHLGRLSDEAHYLLRTNFQTRIPRRAPISFTNLGLDIDRWAEDQDTMGRGGGLVVVDPLHAVFTGDENSSEPARVFWAEFSHLCREHKISLVLCHHTRKVMGNESPRGNALDRVRGSSAHVASARFVIDMSPLANQSGVRRSKITVIKNNAGPTGASMVVEQDPDTGLWRLPLWSTGAPELVDGNPPVPGSSTEIRVSPAQWQILEGLGRDPALTREELVSTLFGVDGKGQDKLRAQLRNLRGKGLVDESDQLTGLGVRVLRTGRF